MKEKIIVIGGGAAGFFAAINIAQKNKNAEVTILERSDKLLYKVEISGGGRCNVTHQCFEPKALTKNYPRGEKELLSVFTRFQPKDTIEWFDKRGVQMKAEPDGRIFPVSNTSSTIINCFLSEAKKSAVKIEVNNGLEEMIKNEDGSWTVLTSKGNKLQANKLILATGSTVRMWKLLASLNHKIQAPVPSLFTFNIKDQALHQLMGISFPKAAVKIVNTKLSSIGPMIITHWGLSGPAILKVSAWGAIELASKNYRFDILVNWTGDASIEDVKHLIQDLKRDHPKKQIANTSVYHFTNRFWLFLIDRCNIDGEKKWADISKNELNRLCENIANCPFTVTGKSTFKEEFVTCGGVSLNEVDFKTMQSKIHQNLFFCGEILNIDAITGGFNFQAAWSTGWLVSQTCEQ